jgi:hypothetical protein
MLPKVNRRNLLLGSLIEDLPLVFVEKVSVLWLCNISLVVWCNELNCEGAEKMEAGCGGVGV